jgi:vacuolar iron transporter family protein
LISALQTEPEVAETASRHQAESGAKFKENNAISPLPPSDQHKIHTVDLRGISFGSPAAIVTSMALIVGLDAATLSKAAVVGALLIIGVADNLTDSLSVHIYQEAERLAERQAFKTTVRNFAARLIVSISFACVFFLFPPSAAIYASVLWGYFLLSGLSYLLAKARGAPPVPEIWKHDGVALAVILIAKVIGLLVRIAIGPA